ncbi:MAG TPA: hypothetical protein GX510_05540 [Firmicutes bacterium]|nr:hypothetical protein [Candidatus Fermentithermobacillaceae bacterium]
MCRTIFLPNRKHLINLLIAEISVFGKRVGIKARVPDAAPENIEAFAVEGSFLDRYDTARRHPQYK